MSRDSPWDTLGQGAGMSPSTSTNGMIGSTASHATASIQVQPEGAAMPGTVAWTAAPPLPYRDDKLPPPHWWAIDLYRRKRRRPRCAGEA